MLLLNTTASSLEKDHALEKEIQWPQSQKKDHALEKRNTTASSLEF